MVAGGLVFWLVREMNKPLGAASLKIAVSELRSNASEAEVIAEQALSGRLTSTYFQTQTIMLRDNSEAVMKSLGSAEPQAGLEEKLSQARELAERITASFGSLSSSFGDRQEMNRVKGEMENDFRRTLELEESLKH